MATATTAPRNHTVTTVKTIAYGMFLLGLGLSVSHIFDFFHSTLHAAVISAAAVPVFIDGLQIIGKLARSARFHDDTRAIGFKVQLTGAALSIVANAVAGHTWGDKLAGVIFVAGYVFAEWFADHLRPAPSKAQTAAVKAAATRKANAAAKQTAAAVKAKTATARKTRKAQQVTVATLTEDNRAYL